jgi:regulator of sigma E protease
VWKRFSIVFFGPIFNILFAAIIFFLIFVNGVPYLLPNVGAVTEGSPAKMNGIEKGDRIVSIDGTSIKRWDQMTSIIHDSAGKRLAIAVKRDSSVLHLVLTPEKKEVKDIFGQEKEVGLIGVAPSGETAVEKVALGEAFSLSVARTWDITEITVLSIVKLVQRVIPAKTIGGPIMIFEMAGREASVGAMNFFTFMAIISINLGVLNLLPIPILDGGHLMFLTIEAVRRKPVSESVVAAAQKVGLALLISLMVLAFYNDILRLITGSSLP